MVTRAIRIVPGRFVLLGLVLSGAICLPGCADLGDPAPDAELPPLPVSFAADVQPIFDANCVVCHGISGNAGLDLRPGLSRGNLVGVMATSAPLLRVAAGDPDLSLIYLKLSGQPPSGNSMPPTGTLLPMAQQELVRRWIAEGAADN